MRWRLGFAALLAIIGGTGGAHSYPDRPVTIILSLGAGTGMDTTVRLYVGLMPIEMPTIEGAREYIKAEQKKWGSLVRKLGLQGSQ